MLMHHAIDEVCVALPVKSHYPAIQEALLVCERVGVRTKYQADLFNSEVAWPRYDDPAQSDGHDARRARRSPPDGQAGARHDGVRRRRSSCSRR